MRLSHPVRERLVATVALSAFLDGNLHGQSHSSPLVRVSVDSHGNEMPDGQSGKFTPESVSGDGRYVAFASTAAELVGPDSGAPGTSVYVHDRASGSTLAASVSYIDGRPVGESIEPSLDRRGRFIAFASSSSLLVKASTHFHYQIYVVDLDQDGDGSADSNDLRATLLSVNASGDGGNADSTYPTISGDGTKVVFVSSASDLVAGDTNARSDIFLRDLVSGVTTRLSVGPGGVEADDASDFPSISDDGRFVVFSSLAKNLVNQDTNHRRDIFLRDLVTGTNEIVNLHSSGRQAKADSLFSAVSGDGHYVAFSSGDALDANYRNRDYEIFVRDRVAATTTLVSTNAAGALGNAGSDRPAISGDGRFVAFLSYSSDFPRLDRNFGINVFLKDVATGTLTLCDGMCGITGDSSGGPPALATNGQVVAFSSNATDLVLADRNGNYDVFARDLTLPDPVAATTDYGQGFAGTLGIPTLTVNAPPVLGSTMALSASNTAGGFTIAFLFVGAERAAIPTGAGGTLLVAADWIFDVALWPGGNTWWVAWPLEPQYATFLLDLQIVEVDPGAADGLAFSRGLELLPGQ